jgi:hypothetical protein
LAIGLNEKNQAANLVFPECHKNLTFMARQNYDFINAFAMMINQHDWSHWCTFTTRREMTLRGARRFAKNIALDFCMPTILCNETRFLWAAEPFDVKDGYHIHALIDVPKTWKGLKQIETSKRQRYGVSHFEAYDKRLGANHYIGKYISKELSDWDFHQYTMLNPPEKHEIVKGVKRIDHENKVAYISSESIWNDLEYSTPQHLTNENRNH